MLGFESVLCVRRPGEYFCPVSVLDRGPQLGTAEAMGEVVLLEADRSEFNALCEENPELLAMVQGTCIGEVRTLMQRVEAFAFRNVRERLAMTILEESHRQRDNGKAADEIRITQQELAGIGRRLPREHFTHHDAHGRRWDGSHWPWKDPNPRSKPSSGAVWNKR